MSEKSPLADRDDEELVALSSREYMRGPTVNVEMMRRLRASLVEFSAASRAASTASDKWAKRLFWATILLAVLTAVIVVLTLVLLVRANS